ncbi:MAG: biotin--[acetyl-CoA-carboxylase] ligase [Thermodesulfovibrio sp.]|nr:biotin--[acetyl-CoA-carboxylase] ligase [Thermodesulfovibrio sp.]MCX7724338.1 biotin--[acetyl-CoA-carboxylase] ligase [Thermodesulfovibrio sp.]
MEFTGDDLKNLLASKTLEIGKEILVYDEVESTNSKANELLNLGYPSGTVIIADTQTKGKGRLGRKWISPPGKNIYMSIALQPNIPPKYSTLLTLTSAVACTTALRRNTDVPVMIKWPNDMLVNDKKIGGILTEMKIEGEKIKSAIVGIGINLNMTEEDIPEDIKDIASSLRIYKGEDFPRNIIIVEIIKEFDRWYQLLEKNQRKTIIDRWMQLSDTIGRQVKIVLSDKELIAIAEAIDEEGRLIVKLQDGTYEKISAGDVTLLRTK